MSCAQSARLGLRRATSLAISSGLFGILYGAACASLGISPALAALSCVLVFSGAVQFAVLGMLADPFSAPVIAVSSLLICNRLFLMGVSMADHLRGRSWAARLLSMPVLTDGAWAATVAEKAPVDRFVSLCAPASGSWRCGCPARCWGPCWRAGWSPRLSRLCDFPAYCFSHCCCCWSSGTLQWDMLRGWPRR
ncbi:AzlC family ABC transporter permease [Siccirubricoccus deserti]